MEVESATLITPGATFDPVIPIIPVTQQVAANQTAAKNATLIRDYSYDEYKSKIKKNFNLNTTNNTYLATLKDKIITVDRSSPDGIELQQAIKTEEHFETLGTPNSNLIVEHIITGGDAIIHIGLKNYDKFTNDHSFMSKKVNIKSDAVDIHGRNVVDLIEVDDMFMTDSNKSFIITNIYKDYDDMITCELDSYLTSKDIQEITDMSQYKLKIFKPRTLAYVFTHKNGQNFTNNKPIVVPSFNHGRFANNGKFVWMISSSCN